MQRGDISKLNFYIHTMHEVVKNIEIVIEVIVVLLHRDYIELLEGM